MFQAKRTINPFTQAVDENGIRQKNAKNTCLLSKEPLPQMFSDDDMDLASVFLRQFDSHLFLRS